MKVNFLGKKVSGKEYFDLINEAIKEFLNIKEKDLFYLNESKIKQKIKQKYNEIISKKYNYTYLDGFLNDIYEILYWSDILEIKYDEGNLKKSFKDIVLSNYYKIENSLLSNLIDRYGIEYENCEKLLNFIDECNIVLKEKYYSDKVNIMEQSFKTNNYNVYDLRWTENNFEKIGRDIMINKARANNYFISNLSGEISNEEWSWDYYVSDIFYNYMDEEYKNEFIEYLQKIKRVNKIQDIRLKALERK